MDKGKELLYLSQRDVVDVGFSMEDLISIMEEAFIEKSKGSIQMPPKIALHPYSNENFIHAMPAFIPSIKAAGMKWISGYATNPPQGLAYINGLMLLTDPETGIPLSVMDGVWITAQRTGAMTGLTAKYLAREDSQSLGILGCGVQGKTNLEAVMSVRPNLKQVFVYDRFPEAAAGYAAEMREFYDIEITVCEQIKDVVTASDILLSCVPAVEDPALGVIQAEWIREGALVAPIDGSVLFEPETLEAMDLKFTDDVSQWNYFKSMGFWFSAVRRPPAELCEAVAGINPGRTSPKQRILAMNIGLGLEDVAVAWELYKKSLADKIGTRLAL